MVSPKHVCVIGAGVSGLAAAKAFSSRGHRVTIVERSADLGGVWEPARSYPDVQTQSPKELYRYTDQRHAGCLSGMADRAAGPRLSRRLCEKLWPRPHAALQHRRSPAWTRRADGKPGWTLDAIGTERRDHSEDFDFVAVCTGQFNEPRELHCPGEDAFRRRAAQILHSSTYNDATLAKGRRVVVLGGSKSATDIAVNAVKSGAAR